MAHLGAAAILFERCDPEMADTLLSVVESFMGTHHAVRIV
jgi:hypothetical protein